MPILRKYENDMVVQYNNLKEELKQVAKKAGYRKNSKVKVRYRFQTGKCKIIPK